ncbi:MAG: 16S rRNA (guanine(966)-N(2))-methyltransferase RsmD [Firmicutes bacterium]|nr:16S rRNA (guanine(966)-N(2))-methyltransferase RsmD [Bacillota bacterium]
MRVIGGRCRGMRLRSVPGRSTRPTPERVRESLFNILGPWLASARVLDLFAGTGALGIEALSRGACEAVFVERDARAVRVIRANLDHTGLSGRALVRTGDVFREIVRLSREGRTFDLVLADPPYRRGIAPRVPLALGESGLLAPGAWAAVEHDPLEEMPPEGAKLTKVRAVRYGDTALAFYRRDETESDGRGPKDAHRGLPGQL